MKKLQAEGVDNKNISLPEQIAKRLGLAAGARLDIAFRRGRVELLPDIHSLSRVYIEPTSRCNISCKACVRQAEGEPQGDMDMGLFRKLVVELKRFPFLESVMLGGLGEPTTHPHILEMIGEIKASGLRVEMVSNGTLLDEVMLKGLIAGRLDWLWVSLDGSDEALFEASRPGAKYKGVLAALRRLRELNRDTENPVKLGLAYVVTKKNVPGLRKIERVARKLGADRIIVSNVIPYTPEMEKEMICAQALAINTFTTGVSGQISIDVPRMDVAPYTHNALLGLMSGGASLSLMGTEIGAREGECRFIRERCVIVRWDGKVAPCMGLMRDHTVYFGGGARRNKRYIVGDLLLRGLWDIWNDADYMAFREKVADFDFSPCHVCGGCYFNEDNAEDCHGNKFPATCGGCLWAQGIIQCT